MSNKQKLVGNRIREEKYGNGETREILEMKLVDKPAKPCKQCKKNPRQAASSRCKQCSEQHFRHNLMDEKLHKKMMTEMERRRNL